MQLLRIAKGQAGGRYRNNLSRCPIPAGPRAEEILDGAIKRDLRSLI
jgi:hypothetical protein